MVELSSLSNQSHYPSPELPSLPPCSHLGTVIHTSNLHQGHRDRCAVCVPQKRERVRCTVEAAIFVCLSRGPASIHMSGYCWDLTWDHRFRELSSYYLRLTTSCAILKPIFAKKLLQLVDFALQQQCFLGGLSLHLNYLIA